MCRIDVKLTGSQPDLLEEITINNLPRMFRNLQNTILSALVFIGTALLPAQASAGNADSSSLQSSPATFGIDGEVLTYIDNIEYTTAERTGETYYGSSGSARLFYRPVSRMLFEIGAYGLRRFGDPQSLSLTLPFFRAQYTSDLMTFTMGSLSTADAHFLPDLLYRQELRFDPGLDEGMQLDMRGKHVNWEIWGVWDSLDSPTEREHFTAGSVVSYSIANYSFPFYLTADHTGGELFNSGEAVEEHFGGAAGIDFNYPLSGCIRSVFGEILLAGTDFRKRTGDNVTGRGDGIFAKAGVSPGGFDCSVQLFRGHDLHMPFGDPIFESNIPYYALEISRSYSVNNHLQALGGWRFETPDITSVAQYFSVPRYRFWLALRGEFWKGL
jgi:hypothetical protein